MALRRGTFSDRVRLDGLALTPGPLPAVRGVFASTVDVSDLLVLRLRADFYDGSGRLVGSGQAAYSGEHDPLPRSTPVEASDSAPVEVAVTAEPGTPPAESAVLAVTQYVVE